jgi:hypothetical protein
MSRKFDSRQASFDANELPPCLLHSIAFSLLAFVVGPALRIEDRPAFKRPDKKVRWLF